MERGIITDAIDTAEVVHCEHKLPSFAELLYDQRIGQACMSKAPERLHFFHTNVGNSMVLGTLLFALILLLHTTGTVVAHVR